MHIDDVPASSWSDNSLKWKLSDRRRGAGRLGLLALKLIVPGNHGLGEVAATAIVALAQSSTALDS